jgi:hypothetical protein
MEYRGYEFLQELMEALIKRDEKAVEKMTEELKQFLVECSDFDRRLFVLSLIDAMEVWANDLKIARQFKEMLREVLFTMYEDNII